MLEKPNDVVKAAPVIENGRERPIAPGTVWHTLVSAVGFDWIRLARDVQNPKPRAASPAEVSQSMSKPVRVNPWHAMIGLFASSLAACQAREVQLLACSSSSECDDGESCNAAGECVPEPLVVDDFEDFDNLPQSAAFAEWLHYSYNPDRQNVAHRVERPGHNSNGSLLLEWVVLDAPDGGVNGTGAGLVSRSANDYVDLSRFSRLLFSHTYADLYFRDEIAGDCISTPSFRVSFGCREYGAVFEATVYMSQFGWDTANLPWTLFKEPSLPATGVAIEDCLAYSDGLNFATNTPLEDGQCGSGTLMLDSIAFR